MVFKDVNSCRRTDNSFRSKEDANYHRDTSVFEGLPIDMVSIFPLDYMHLVCLGVVRRQLGIWLRLAKQRQLGLGNETIACINERLQAAESCIPKDFQRRCRSLEFLQFWKVTECRLFRMYLGPVVLHDLLPSPLYANFLRLFTSVYILCHPRYHLKLCDTVKQQLRQYVLCFDSLYPDELVYNVHALQHLAEDVSEHGCLDTFSVFPYESHLCQIKGRVRSGFRVAKQVASREVERCVFASSTNAGKSPAELTTPCVTVDLAKQLFRVGKTYHSTVSPDRFVVVNGVPGIICGVGEGNVFKFRPCLDKQPFFNKPFESTKLDIYK
uniref:Uncharacterized protein n=1 Tax=Trichobilharzia regenti TaxID=157069 RepID=A0AA85J410_TRIRE|nr:unnamed protein product [Trichobilharzia regenti]